MDSTYNPDEDGSGAGRNCCSILSVLNAEINPWSVYYCLLNSCQVVAGR